MKKKSLSPNADNVRAYLAQNPDFIVENAAFLAGLFPAERGENVVDLQSVRVERLRDEVTSLKNFHGSLIDATRGNMTTQLQVHGAILSLWDAENPDHLSHIVSRDWIDSLQVDAIIINFEKDHETPLPPLKDMNILDRGFIEDFLGQDDATLLRGDITVSEEIFGPATPLIQAEALIRLPESDFLPPGMLAFGSRDADMFSPGQGTELLRFLAAGFSRSLVQWLRRI